MFEEDGPVVWEDKDVVTEECWVVGQSNLATKYRKCMRSVPVSDQLGAAIHRQV